jgi:1-deoxy-D-xylulose-5-phosphate synthase
MRWVKPIDTELLADLARSHDAFVTLEEHVIMGGAGSAVLEAMAEASIVKSVLQLGLPDRFIDHGEQGQLLRLAGLDGAGIEASVRQRFGDLMSGTMPRLVANRSA